MCPKKQTDFTPHFKSLTEKWPSAFVAREKIAEFTGGAITPGRMANLDCQGVGPERIRIGRKICYPVTSLVRWLEERAENL